MRGKSRPRRTRAQRERQKKREYRKLLAEIDTRLRTPTVQHAVIVKPIEFGEIKMRVKREIQELEDAETLKVLSGL